MTKKEKILSKDAESFSNCHSSSIDKHAHVSYSVDQNDAKFNSNNDIGSDDQKRLY